jgi:hypothetical protein
MNCEECGIDLDDMESKTCGHTGTLFWCSVHKRYECENCSLKDEKKEILNGEE